VIAMTATTYSVEGMTCGHCVSSVTEEVGQVRGVIGVEVDLATGLVTVNSDAPVDDAAIRAAVEEAGYDLMGPS
jgi:copper ion binding protein